MVRVDVSAFLSLPDAEEGVLRDMLVANLQLRQNAGAAVMQLVDGAERPSQRGTRAPIDRGFCRHASDTGVRGFQTHKCLRRLAYGSLRS
jgi:hypothetical protein